MTTGWPFCNECGHEHQGAGMAFICIGCPCPVRPPQSEIDAMRQRREREQLERRRQRLVEEMKQIVADANSWNLLHPNEQSIVIDTNIEKDVEAALLKRAKQG